MTNLTARRERLGTVVHRLRLERKITQEALAFKSNVTISALSRIERGLASPVFTTVEKLADALEISLSELAFAAEGDEA